MKRKLTPQDRIELGPDENWSGHGNVVAMQARERLLRVPYLEEDDIPPFDDKDPKALVEDGTLLAYTDHQDLLFPAFQFDPSTEQPREVVTQINRILDAPHDGWGVTAWWVQENGRLPMNTAPIQILGNFALHPVLIQIAEGMADYE